MAHLIESMDLAQVLAEAEDIARSVNQKLTSAHQLLAFFTVPNRAEVLLRDRGIDEDRILQAMTEKPAEPEGIERGLRDRAREVAAGVGADEVDCLHLLIAMSRVRACAAYQLLAACGLQLSALRNVALSYFTSRMPRRLRELAPLQVKVGPAPARRPAAAGPATPATGDRRPATEPVSRLPAADAPAATPAATPAPAASPSAYPTPAPSSARLGHRTSAAAQPLGAHALDPAEYPWLSSLGRNLTELAEAGKLDPLIGREREIDEAIDILGKRRTNNPLLVGEPGVGKTSWWRSTWRAWSRGRSSAARSRRS
jgi:ATP-dependent Clp protease ATP-binding subunit ClpC